MKSIFLLVALLSLPPYARAGDALESAADFLGWLEEHGKEFAACEPRREKGDYVLCDATRVPAAELKRLFAMKPAALLAELKKQGLKVELVCAAEGEKSRLGTECAAASKNKMFAELTSLHGKYLPEEKTILIRSSASPGSLVHEWVHARQAENEQEIYGRKYKQERVELQRSLTRLMDNKIAQVQALEKAGRKAETAAAVKEFMLASETTRAFAPWQDLIDERGIFLLYLKYGPEFGAKPEDLALAQKNMGFLCRNPKLKPLLPEKQCAL